MAGPIAFEPSARESASGPRDPVSAFRSVPGTLALERRGCKLFLGRAECDIVIGRLHTYPELVLRGICVLSPLFCGCPSPLERDPWSSA